MSDRTAGTARILLRYRRHRQLRAIRRLTVSSLTLTFALWCGWSAWEWRSSPTERPDTVASSPVPPAEAVPAGSYVALLDPGFAIGAAPVPLHQSSPLSAEWRPAVTASAALSEPQIRIAELDGVPAVAAPLEWPALAEATPVTTPRAVEAQQAPKLTERPRVADAAVSRRPARIAASALAVPQDNRSFLEKIFGQQQPATPALAYAAPQDAIIDNARGQRLSPTPKLDGAQLAAVYDITSQTVYMPNGEKLEAHSGLGDRLDDPRFVHERMRGATPPHVYDLTLRESLFHGVRAIRLNPVGGSAAIHGRDGLLAHTFMLGPKGDSNGCISIRNYDKFLQAYLRGEVKRLIVVAKMS